LKLIIVGCDYTGKTSLAGKIVGWMRENLSPRYANDVPVGAHDHFWFPNPELPPDEREKLRLLGPKAREQYQRYMISYHLQPVFWSEDYDLVLVGFHFSEAIYAPLYYGYGEAGAYAARSAFAREIEAQIVAAHPETVLLMLRASSEVIRRRLAERPNAESPLRLEDVERVIRAHDEEYENSLIRRRFIIDGSDLSVEGMFERWLASMQSYFSPVDMLRMLTRKRGAGSGG
jgi:hypothetical protein